MKTIGLIGGMSWESSLEYYRYINQGINRALGDSHSGRILMNSVDFEPVKRLQYLGEWNELRKLMSDAAGQLKAAGAELLAICSNTMHRVADHLEEETSIPLVHIADATAIKIKEAGIGRVLLLGTRFTMEQHFYRERLEQSHGIEVIIPGETDMQRVNSIIYDELVKGKRLPASRIFLSELIAGYTMTGNTGVVLGCTELPLLVNSNDMNAILFDTMRIHCDRIVELMLKQRK